MIGLFLWVLFLIVYAFVMLPWWLNLSLIVIGIMLSTWAFNKKHGSGGN